MPFSLVFLGTSAGMPCRTRNVSSYGLRAEDGRVILVDCGEGTQHRLLLCPEIKHSKLEAILITHLHGDHSFGLPGLLSTLSLMGRKEPLKLVGPAGIGDFVRGALDRSYSYISYPLEIVELTEGKCTELGEICRLQVAAYPLIHRVPCFGYVITEPDRRGKLDAKKAKELGVTNGKELGVLANGGTIQLADGRTVKSEDVLGPPIKGKKFVLLGDTSNSDSLLEAGKGCDVVVHEATYDASLQEKAIDGGHSTSKMAGAFAAKLHAKLLILTHFSQRYAESDGSECPTISDLVAEAQRECEGISVVAAQDFGVVRV